MKLLNRFQYKPRKLQPSEETDKILLEKKRVQLAHKKIRFLLPANFKPKLTSTPRPCSSATESCDVPQYDAHSQRKVSQHVHGVGHEPVDRVNEQLLNFMENGPCNLNTGVIEDSGVEGAVQEDIFIPGQEPLNDFLENCVTMNESTRYLFQDALADFSELRAPNLRVSSEYKQSAWSNQCRSRHKSEKNKQSRVKAFNKLQTLSSDYNDSMLDSFLAHLNGPMEITKKQNLHEVSRSEESEKFWKNDNDLSFIDYLLKDI